MPTPPPPQPSEQPSPSSKPDDENDFDNDPSPADELKFMFDDDIEEQNQAEQPKPPNKSIPSSPSNEDPNASNPFISDPEQDAQPQTPIQEEDEEPDLFTKLLQTPSAVTGIVTDWMASIQTNGPAAMSEVLSFVVRASRPVEAASTELITSAMIVQNEPAASIALIDPILRSDTSGRVVITARDPPSKKTRRAYEDFWRRIASEATEAVLFDTDCFDTLICWLEAMACAKSRALRMAACLAAYRIVDGFIDVGTRIRKSLNSMHRQLVTEKKKCGHVQERSRKTKRSVKPLSKKGQELAKKVEEMTANNGELVELSDKVFRSMFVLKFRDIAPEIRALSVSAVGDWIIAYPDHFLDDIHSKYIGWLLSDKDPTVRKSSLQILTHMLESKDFFPSLEHFLSRFCSRIVDMSRDKDDGVTVAAIHLLTRLVEFDLLEPASCEQICDLALEETHTDIRRAAGEFMARLVYADADEGDRIQGSAAKSGSVKKKPLKRHRPLRKFVLVELEQVPSPERAMDDIRELVFTFSRKGDRDATPDLLVDSVWDHMPALRCWEAFTRLLSEKDPTESPPSAKRSSRRKAPEKPDPEEDNSLSDNDKAILCEILLASIRESCGKGDKSRAKLVERGECNSDETPGILASKHFIPLLPNLLVQFQVDPRALAALVQLPMYLPFETDASEEKSAETLVTKLVDVLTRHTGSPAVINSCASAFKNFLAEDSPMKKTTHGALQKACTVASKELTLQVRSGLSKAEPSSVAASILQVRVTCELIESSPSIWSSTSKLLMFQCEEGNDSDLGDNVTTDAIRIACALLMWSLSKFKSRIEDTEDQSGRKATEVEETNVRELGNDVVMVLSKVCNCDAFQIHVKVVALQALLTALTLARGVENFAASVWIPDADKSVESGKGDTASTNLDFLGISSDLQEILVTVKSCAKSLLEYELFASGHNAVRFPGNKKPRRSAELTEQVVRDCFISLLQASFQSALSKEISYLPLLGLLVRDRRGPTEGNVDTSLSVFELCRRYYQQRQAQEPEKIREAVKALSDVSFIHSPKDRPYHFVWELAEILSGAREPGHTSKDTSRDTLVLLTDDAMRCPKNSTESQRAIGVLACAGVALIGMVSKQDADSLLVKTDELKFHAIKDTELEIEPVVMKRFESYYNAIKALTLGKSPDIPKLTTARKKSKTNWSSPGLKTKKRRPRRPTKKNDDLTSAVTENLNVRRSGRDKKRINYAQLGGTQSESGSEEDITSQLSASDEDADDGENGDHVSSAVAMARNLMEYNNSTPVAKVSKKANKQRSTEPEPESSSNDEEDEEIKEELEDTQRDVENSSVPSGVRRSSRRIQKSMKLKATSQGSGSNQSNRSNPAVTPQKSRHSSKSSNTQESTPSTNRRRGTSRKKSAKTVSPGDQNKDDESAPESPGQPESERAVETPPETTEDQNSNSRESRPKRRQRKPSVATSPIIVRKRQRRW